SHINLERVEDSRGWSRTVENSWLSPTAFDWLAPRVCKYAPLPHLPSVSIPGVLDVHAVDGVRGAWPGPAGQSLGPGLDRRAGTTNHDCAGAIAGGAGRIVGADTNRRRGARVAG